MKIKSIILSVLMTSLSSLAFSQNTDPLANARYIEVTGVAEMEVVPDEIYVTIIVRERANNKRKFSIEEQEKNLKNALQSIGIDLKNLSLANANADFVKVRWKKEDVITQKDYLLKVGDATTLSKVFSELDKLEIKDAYIQRVNHSRMELLKKEVKIKAIKNAKEKVDYLLGAIGEKAGKPLVINENDNSPMYMEAMNYRSKNISMDIDGNAAPEPEVELEFRKIKLQSNVYFKCSID